MSVISVLNLTVRRLVHTDCALSNTTRRNSIESKPRLRLVACLSYVVLRISFKRSFHYLRHKVRYWQMQCFLGNMCQTYSRNTCKRFCWPEVFCSKKRHINFAHNIWSSLILSTDKQKTNERTKKQKHLNDGGRLTVINPSTSTVAIWVQL